MSPWHAPPPATRGQPTTTTLTFKTMLFFLQEKPDATPTSARLRCPLQCQVTVDALDGKVRFSDSALPPYGVFAKPFPIQQEWTQEFIETLFGLEMDESLEFLLSDGLIYPAQPRRWVYPAKTMVRASVYPLSSARHFILTAINERYYAQSELGYRRKRATKVAQDALAEA